MFKCIFATFTVSVSFSNWLFLFLGLDARVHYNSRTETEETVSFDTSKDGTCWVSTTKKIGGKKATLCAWITLQSIPQETIITPNILQFLEQALEPIPTLGFRDQARVNEDLFEDSSSGSHNGHVTSAVGSSFPVDVIVHFHMQSSTFRFSCVPVSLVETKLHPVASANCKRSSSSTAVEHTPVEQNY